MLGLVKALPGCFVLKCFWSFLTWCVPQGPLLVKLSFLKTNDEADMCWSFLFSFE